MENIITVKGLKKEFKVPQKSKEGFIASAKSLFKREFKMVTAVDGIDLEIGKGEIRALIGPNGAGKSTTIKMLSGILYPTEGEIKVMGYTPWLQREQYVRQIGVVLGQKSQLIWELPAIDTYLLNREMYRIPEQRFRENIEYFKQLLNLEELLKKPVRQLSLGERMKCELVCAMLHDPQLVYLDEPTIGLDILAKDSIRGFIKQINKDKNITFILTTHDLDDIMNLCENITIINKGIIVYNDSLDNLKSFFSNKKTVEIKFSERINRERLNGFNVLSFEPLEATVEVNLSKNNLQDEVYKIFGTLPVNDINIGSIGIEEVIKQIYNE